MNSLDMRCADVPPEDPKTFLCLPLAGRAAVPEGNWPSFGDPRVTAIVPISGDTYMFDVVGDKTRKGILRTLSHQIRARFKNGVFWVPVDEPMPTGKRQLFEGVE